MYNKKELINKSQENKQQILKTSSNLFSVPSLSLLDINKMPTVLKKKEYTSPTSIWTNSVYSFNKNYIKNIPSVDKIVNKLIKSFFTINALANNIRGRKLKLMQRKFKNLSLNRIFVSKSEIKHSNNKVTITVYLFNKKKRSLLLKLNKLQYSLSKGFANKSRPWAIKNNFEKLASRFTSLKPKLSKLNNIRDNMQVNPNLSLVSHNISKTSRYLRKVFIKRYGFVPKPLKSSKPIWNKNRKSSSSKNFNQTAFKLYNNKISYYKRLNDLTKYNINRFIVSLNLNNTKPRKDNFYKIIQKFFVYTNKYKLYKNNIYLVKESFTSLPLVRLRGKGLITTFNHSITKLKSVNKLFALRANMYNNFKSNVDTNTVHSYTKTFLLYTYKLLRKSYKDSKFAIRNLSFNSTKAPFFVEKNKLKNINKSGKGPTLKYSTKTNNKLKKLTFKKVNNNKKLVSRNIFKSNLKVRNSKAKQSIIMLANKLNRIDRFFNRYKKTLLIDNSYSSLSTLNTQLVNNYKVSFINDILKKEILYISYLKLLAYNNIVFKNWFLFPLKSILSKIYNKKIVFNIVNLKYIHLNSDILSQGVDIRLKNFRKNNLIQVLKKAIKLVTISKVNPYICDENSSTFKYIDNYFNKFKSLKFDVFKDLSMIENKVKSHPIFESNIIDEKSGSGINNTNINGVHKPCGIRRLNQAQTDTINFIKFKSVFGARLEAAGRLTKRSTASRALFKFKYKGTLKNNTIMNNSPSATMIKNHQISNIQFTKISSKTRNGSFGLKGWINSN